MIRDDRNFMQASRAPLIDTIPAQAIPTKKKNKQHWQDTMDALESIGCRQYRENERVEDFLRMVEGKQSIKEVKEFLPFLKEYENRLAEEMTPSYIRHYDLIGMIINASVQEYMINRDVLFVHSSDELSTNEYERTQTVLMNRYIRENFNKELERRLMAEGLETDVSQIQFESEEEEAEYISFLESRREALTPDSIKSYMTSDFRPIVVSWGEATLEQDEIRFKESRLDQDNLSEMLATGKCFRHFRVGYDFYDEEFWSVREVFHSKESNLRYPQEAEYIGRITFMTPSQILSRFGDILPQKTVDRLHTNVDASSTNADLMPYYLRTPYTSEPPKVLPDNSYLERELTKAWEQKFEVPMTNIWYIGENGELETTKGYSSGYFDGRMPSLVQQLYKHSHHGNLRDDVYQITEAYFTDYQKMGLLCYLDEFGIPQFDHITDEILPEVLEELGIKQVKKVSIKEMREKKEPNTLTWFYKPISRKGIKINLANLSCESFYLVEKSPCQIRGNSNMFSIKHPVAGIIGSSMADKLENFQALYNYNMNKLQELAEKEIGIFFLFDLMFLPSDQKGKGTTDETMQLVTDIARQLGIWTMDTSMSNTQDASRNNQFYPVDMTLGKQMQQCMQNALFYKSAALEQIGIHLGQQAPASGYKTAEGVRVDQQAMYAQLEHYFSQFTDFLTSCHDIHLAVAQYAQRNEKDITVHFTKNDGHQFFLKFVDPNFTLRTLGVYATTNAKERKKQEQIRQYFLNNNTMATDPLGLAEILLSDNVSGLLQAARNNRVYIQSLETQRAQNDQETNRQRAQLERENAVFTHELQEQSKAEDRKAEILKATITAQGRANYGAQDSAVTSMLSKMGDQSLKQIDIESRERIANKTLDAKVTSSLSSDAREDRRLELQERALDIREQEIASKSRNSVINKN